MKLGKYFTGKFMNIFLKRPTMVIGAFLLDEDEYFIYITEDEGGEVNTAIPRNNIATISLDDQVTFLMDKIDVSDSEVQ
jgi:hypothetical protein